MPPPQGAAAAGFSSSLCVRSGAAVENEHRVASSLLAVIGFNSLSFISIKSQENTGMEMGRLIAYGNSAAVSV